MKRILTFTLSALILSAPALAQTAPEQRKTYMEKPIGEGEPSGISCYRPPSSFSRISKLECRTNSEWAQIYASDNHDNRIDTGKMGNGAPVNIIP